MLINTTKRDKRALEAVFLLQVGVSGLSSFYKTVGLQPVEVKGEYDPWGFIVAVLGQLQREASILICFYVLPSTTEVIGSRLHDRMVR